MSRSKIFLSPETVANFFTFSSGLEKLPTQSLLPLPPKLVQCLIASKLQARSSTSLCMVVKAIEALYYLGMQRVVSCCGNLECFGARAWVSV